MSEQREIPKCRCETCVDHRMRILREINRILIEQEKSGQPDFRLAVQRFINDQQKFHDENVLGNKR